MALWIEETDKQVWHLANRRIGPLHYTAVCGWQMTARPTRIWPQKPHELGPAREERCWSCVGREVAKPNHSRSNSAG